MNLENRKLNILIPIMEFGKAGGLKVISELANHWTDLNHNVTIIANYESELPYYETKSRIIWINEKGEEVNNKPKTQVRGGGVLRISYSIYCYLKKHSREYDIVLGNYNITTIPIFLASKSNNFYYIQAYEPGFYIGKSFSNNILKFIAWMTYFLPLKRIVNADIYKNYKNIRSKYVIPPGLNLNTFYPKELKFKNKDEIVVGCIGRHEEWKGSEDVASAIKILHEKGCNIKFKVAFNPVKYENHELVQPDGAENLANYYRSLDILVAPGHIQLGAIHYPVIEAMACNVPVITTGYYPANDDNSFIVPVKRPDKIAETIELIMNDYNIAIDKAGKARKDIVQFDWKNVSSKFIEVFNAAIRTKK